MLNPANGGGCGELFRLENQVPLSQLSERYQVHVNLLYRWKKQLFESASDIFSQVQVRESQGLQGKVVRLENRLKDKNQLISELVEENITLKKVCMGKFKWSLD